MQRIRITWTDVDEDGDLTGFICEPIMIYGLMLAVVALGVTIWLLEVGGLEASTAITSFCAFLDKLPTDTFILAANKFLTVSLLFMGGVCRIVVFPTVFNIGWFTVFTVVIGLGFINIWELQRRMFGTDCGLLGALNENIFAFVPLTQTTFETMLLTGEVKIELILLELALVVLETVVANSPSFSRANNLLAWNNNHRYIL